ncbi:MAG: response regulator [Verrucomicrobia bacterium]|nr:response regulator [Verrucomicrobiota bacterium]
MMPASNSPATNDSINLLLVDDQPRNLDVLETILEAPGYRFVRATSGEGALLALMQDEFAAIVLDIQMPGMSGLELARLIKQRKRNQHIPILFLTAHFMDDTDILEGYGVGAVDYLTKPVNPQILRSKVGVFVELFRATRSLARTNSALESEVLQRREAQEALRRVNGELETRVQQRTAQLSRSEEQFRRAVNDGPTPVIILAQDGQVLQINKAWSHLTGYSIEELPTLDAWLTLAYRFGANEVRRAVRSLFERDAGMVEVEFEILTRAGEKRVWAFSASSPGILSDDRRFVVGTAVDITERKNSEDLLRQSEERYRHLLHALPAAVYTCDARGRITLYNQAAIDLWGGEPEIGRDLWCGSLRIYKPDGTLLSLEDCPMAVPIRDGKANQGQEIVIERHDGSRRDVIVYPHPLHDANGDVTGGVNMLVDVTELKKVEAALREAKNQAETASKAKDDFLAALSHELRTPLNPALLRASEREQDIRLPADVRDDFAAIRQDIELEARLIDDLLDLTRITHGKLRVEPYPVDLHSLLRTSWERLKPEADHKKLSVRFELASTEAWVKADPVRIQQVFGNVMKNAVRFTPANGEISIRTHKESPHEWRVEVVDSGMGIESHELENIFTPFIQGNHGHRSGGLGLGLAISRRLVELHGGRIEARSEGRQRGAIFSVHLPAAKPTIENLNHRIPPSNGGIRNAARRILLVEDHDQTRITLARLLTQRGHEVAMAGNIEEALARAQTFAFDLVLSDLGLPDGSGHDLIAELRRMRPACRSIAISGYGMESDTRRSTDAGFDAHLTKPVDIQALEKALNSSFNA